MVNNTLADLISRIRMGAQTRKRSISVPNTNIARRLAVYFAKQNLILSYQISVDERRLEIFFRFSVGSNENVLAKLAIISKPGRRIYLKHENLVTRYKRKEHVLISTPAGLLSHRSLLGNLKRFRLSGEPLAVVRH